MEKILSLFVFIFSIFSVSVYSMSSNLKAANPARLENTWHFDRNILKDSAQTKRLLLQERFGNSHEHFEEVEIDSQDITMFGQPSNIRLRALFLERKDVNGHPNAKATIVCFHGFHPDRKELFAPFVKIAPQNCNLLFVDIKSHGESPGGLLIGKVLTGMYGKTEHLDVIHTCKYVAQKTNGKPQIILGRSTGTLFATKALIQLKTVNNQMNFIDKFNIKGLILDSGFESIYDAAGSYFIYLKNRLIQAVLGRNTEANQPSIWSLLTFPFEYLTSLSCSLIYKLISIGTNFILPHITNLNDTIGVLGNLPVMFIHSQDDSYSSFEKMYQLARKLPPQNVMFWKIQSGRSRHAKHHLDLRDEYKNYMQQFIHFALNYKSRQPNEQRQSKNNHSTSSNRENGSGHKNSGNPGNINKDLGTTNKLGKNKTSKTKTPTKTRFSGIGSSSNGESPRYIPGTSRSIGSNNSDGNGKGYNQPYNYSNPPRHYPSRGFGSPNFDNIVWAGGRGNQGKNKATEIYDKPLYLNDYHKDPKLVDQPDPIPIKKLKKTVRSNATRRKHNTPNTQNFILKTHNYKSI